MGIRGEIFSTKAALPNRTYFFNVKENRMGDLYLNIVESKNKDSGGFERQSLVLFAEDLQVFLSGFDESLKVLEKAVREKRRGEKTAPAYSPEKKHPASGRTHKNYTGEKSGNSRKNFSKENYRDKPKGNHPKRKVVVKKKKNSDDSF